MGNMKIISSFVLTRYLLSKDCNIKDIKPCKFDKKRSIFIFEVDENFTKAMDEFDEDKYKAEQRQKFLNLKGKR